jgi:hypothetical protein
MPLGKVIKLLALTALLAGAVTFAGTSVFYARMYGFSCRGSISTTEDEIFCVDDRNLRQGWAVERAARTDMIALSHYKDDLRTGPVIRLILDKNLEPILSSASNYQSNKPVGTSVEWDAVGRLVRAGHNRSDTDPALGPECEVESGGSEVRAGYVENGGYRGPWTTIDATGRCSIVTYDHHSIAVVGPTPCTTP